MQMDYDKNYTPGARRVRDLGSRRCRQSNTESNCCWVMKDRPAFPQNKPMKAKYPPTAAIGKYWMT